MSELTKLLKYKEEIEDADFIGARDALSGDFHTYDEEEGVMYEDYRLDGYTWRTGITKVVVILNDFVMKKGFHGLVKDSDENGFLEPEDFIYVAWDINYGTLEYQVYVRAVARGVSQFFADMEALGDEVYAQEKCAYTIEDVMYDNTPLDKDDWVITHSAMSNDEFEGIMEDLGKHDIWDLDSHIRGAVIPWFYFNYSYEELRKLADFLNEYDINDIHTANAGFFWNKEKNKYEIKMFDYSGFASDTSEIIANEKL